MVNTEEAIAFLENAGVSLEHSGVKGMRWGVRRNLSGHVKTGAIKKKKTEDNLAPGGYGNVYTGRRAKAMNQTLRKAKGKINSGTRILNNDPRFKGQDFKKDSPLRREYYKEYSKMVETQLNAAATLKGNSNRGQYRLNFKYDYESNAFPEVTMKLNSNLSGRVEERKAASEIRKTVGGLKVKHSEEPEDDEITLRVVWGPNGEIEELEDIPDDMFHAEEATFDIPELDNVLEHYGKKGMKWGVRNSRPTSGSTARSKTTESASPRTKKPMPATSNKDKHKQAENAEEGPKESKYKLPQELSDAELRTAVNRLTLERQYVMLYNASFSGPPEAKSRKRKAAEWVSKTMLDVGKDAVKDVAKELAKNALRSAVKSKLGPKYTDFLPDKNKKKDNN